jgi:Protein of unknown function (DUF3098)
MAEKKQAPPPPQNLFSRTNYIWIIVGIIIMAIGIFLMAGGKSDDPNVFKFDQVYSSTRITIAPILILLGLSVEVYAIFKKQKG